jgi:hypothetical protein
MLVYDQRSKASFMLSLQKRRKGGNKDSKRTFSIPGDMPRPRAPERAAGPKVADTVHRDYKQKTLRLNEPVAFLENPIHP